ncbi:MarR family winged helix-turn-helix transcriptional regulator [Actinophytocola oryzae]|uniref:DNA-binding MarR family transcriptional regulator n=1 Tax=Actinophytocola oryzae TaxID=502181 RepID=A0A4V3FR43_9PSEU|nr:MarR family transcriptional regulator [Actinophytocola oryzae]TDV42151.1 DNA-binding MarR family transcriptional regulator [Actinophytocola oryzae]
MTDVPDDFADVLHGVHRLMRRTLRAGVVGPPIRGAQVELLRLVDKHPGVRVSHAAERLGLAGNTVSTLVNELAEAGLLHREKAADDRRAAVLHLTPVAEKRMRDWQERREALMREQVGRLSVPDRAALAAAVPALRRLAQGLRKEVDGT